MKFKTRLVYDCAGKSAVLCGGGDDTCRLHMGSENGAAVLELEAQKPVTVKRLEVTLPYKFSDDCRIYVNGFQSWTDSREYMPQERMSELSAVLETAINSRAFAFTGLNRSGDGTFHKYPRKSGVFYGFSYGYVRNGERVELFASLSERTGYTIITFDTRRGCITIEKDLEGKEFSGRSEVMRFAVIAGEYDAVFDGYFKLLGIPAPKAERACGYTTWYNYYSNVTQDIVMRDLKSLKESGIKADFFQIDDGYQAATGDWLITDEKKFPGGMKAAADAIHNAGMKAGLWLAPFAAVKGSRVFKEHPDWIVRDKKGAPFITGPNWGTFCALDIYNPDAREYIRGVFDTVLNDWGFDLVKLDFLYAAAVLPIHGRTRGEIMCEAMDFLRECCGSKLILGCGVPLMPAFGKVDYCRIGADVTNTWKPRRFTTREDVSTPHGVNNSVFRRHLDGRAFLNDPDVFFLRESNMNMSFEQRRLHAKVNSLFGSLLFMSDNISEYSERQMQLLKEIFSGKKARIISAGYTDRDRLEVRYELDGTEHFLAFDPQYGRIFAEE